jgi:hypothetical protein
MRFDPGHVTAQRSQAGGLFQLRAGLLPPQVKDLLAQVQPSACNSCRVFS